MTRRKLSLRLLSITRRVLPPLAASIAARVVFLMIGVCLYALGGWAVASLAAGASAWSIPVIIVCAVVLSLLKGGARYLEQFAGHFVAFHCLAMLRNYFYDQLEPQAPAGTDRLDSGDIMNRVTKDIDRVEVFFAHTLAPVTTAVIVPILTLMWMGTAVSWAVAAVLGPFLVIVGAIIPFLGSGATARAARELRDARGALAAHVTDSVQGVREVLAFGAQERREAEMDDIEARIDSGLGVQGRWIALRRGLNQAAVAAGIVTVAMVAGTEYLGGALTLPQVGLAIGIAMGSFGPVLAVEEFAADLDQAFASAARVFAITDRAPAVVDPANPVPLTPGNIVISDVTFAYPTDEDAPVPAPTVLDGVNIRIPAGKHTAIVGASGSGKSTLASLLTRTWDPASGTVTIGGTNVADASLTDLRSTVAYAPQRPYLFNDTLRANLLLAAPDATDEDLESALEAVDLTGWLATEKDGLDTVVGNMGERLSGGQRQRLALARALLRNVPIYVLDEATSQVDPATEARVREGIARVTADSTIVEIAHRISAVRDADLIIVMDAGRVIEMGTYAELRARGGALAALEARETDAQPSA